MTPLESPEGDGAKPARPKRKPFLLRLPPSLMEELRRARADLMMADANLSQHKRLLAYEQGRVRGREDG